MKIIVVIGNPVMSSAETKEVIKVYDSLEEAEKEFKDAILETPETIDGVCYSFKNGTPYRNFNKIMSGDKLKKNCEGQGWGGWEIHGSDCPCGRDPENYSAFESPVYIELQLEETNLSRNSKNTPT